MKLHVNNGDIVDQTSSNKELLTAYIFTLFKFQSIVGINFNNYEPTEAYYCRFLMFLQEEKHQW